MLSTDILPGWRWLHRQRSARVYDVPVGHRYLWPFFYLFLSRPSTKPRQPPADVKKNKSHTFEPFPWIKPLDSHAGYLAGAEGLK